MFKWDYPYYITVNNANVSKLIVDFNDDVPNDVAILIRKQRMYMSKEDEDNNNGCILSGHLRDEPLAAVTVSGCPGSGTFQVIPLSSKNQFLLYHYYQMLLNYVGYHKQFEGKRQHI